MSKPLISVVIPVYNQERYIEKTLKSVLGQQGASFEVVAVNDGSTDRSTEILRKFSDRIVLVEQENMGLDKVRNVGIKRAQGEMIAFLDSDDRFLPGHLAGMVEFAGKHPEAFAFYGDARVIDPDDKPLWVQKSAPVATLQNLVLGNFVIHSSVVVRRRLLEAGEFYRPFGPAADWDFWLRALEYGELVHYPWVGVEYRKHPQSAIHDKLMLSEEMSFKTLDWVFEKHPELGEKIRKQATANVYCESMVRFLAGEDLKQARARASLCLHNDPVNAQAWQGLILSLLPKTIMREIVRLWRKTRQWRA
jgi:glycosyltransferase involved in cell wall biosynthesis